MAEEVRSEAHEPQEAQPKRIGDLLVAQGAVSRSQLAEALLQQSASGKRVGELLVELGAVGERELTRILSEQLGVPVVDLRQEQPQPDAVELISETIARAQLAIPLRVSDGALVVAVADPSAQKLSETLAAEAGCPVVLRLAPVPDIRKALDGAYRALEDVDRFVEAFQEAERRRKVDSVADEIASEDAPVVHVVNLIMEQARRDRASDVHIEPQDGRIRLRFRIDGALHDVLALPSEMGPAVVSRIKILAGMNIVERRRPQDGQFTMVVNGTDLDVRVSTTATIWGEKAVLRLLDKSGSILRLTDLGMHAHGGGILEAFEQKIRSPFGMVVVAGPTGSGKTTTLYAALAELNHSERNIMTVEDPVEYVMPSINQLQINESADVTFAAGLKSILRQDPDIILVGEIRDRETARLAVQSALTGHFVLSSIHATDAAGALQRFLDMQIEPFLVASSMVGVASQRLLRRICQECRVPAPPSPEELAFYEESGGPKKYRSTFWRGAGCNFCSRTGFRGRVGVFEMMSITDEIRSMLVSGARHDELKRVGEEQGMIPMRKAAMQLVADDVTTIDEVIRAIYLL